MTSLRTARSRLLFWIFFLWLGTAGWAQDLAQDLVLVVVVPAKVSLEAPAVDRWVSELKSERGRAGWNSESLPLLRLSFEQPSHRKILDGLNIAPPDGLATYLCRRESRGWPVEVIGKIPTRSSAERFFAQLRQHASPVRGPAAETSNLELGVLLLYDKSSDNEVAKVKHFLEELGHFWLQRYGRSTPAPYPLAAYDTSDRAVVASLSSAFPELSLSSKQRPQVALCLFDGGVPEELLEVYDEMELPASLVRQLSSARSSHLARGPLVSASRQSKGEEIPEVSAVGLDSRQQKFMLVSRLNEAAQHLWTASQDEADSPEQRGPKRLLLAILEECRTYLQSDREEVGSLLELLRDYEVEPLPPLSSERGRDAEGLFNGLVQTLLRDLGADK